MNLVKALTLSVIFLSASIVLFGQTGYNTNTLPVGNIEPLMANTGTGGIQSSGSVYYNPAALTQLDGASFSLSGTAFTKFGFNIDNAVPVGGEKVSYSGSGFQSIPTSMIMVKSIAAWKLGFSVLIPMKFRYEGPKYWDVHTASGPASLAIEQNYEEGQMLIGLSAARKINDYWSLGVSGYVQANSILSINQIRYTNKSNPVFTAQESSRTQYNPYHFVMLVGVQYSRPKWGIGARITLPNMYLFGEGSYTEYIYYNTSTLPATSSSVDLPKQKAVFKTPLDLRIGLSVKVTNKWMLCADNSYTLAQEYNVFESAVYPLTTKQSDIFRSSIGSEYAFSNKFFCYSGIALSIPFEQSGYHFYTGTAGIKVKTQHIENMIGMFYSQGGGDNQTLKDAKEHYVSYGIFLGTNYKF